MDAIKNKINAFVEKYTIDPLAAEKLGCYVYMLMDPSTHKPFYVGKGNGSRVLDHFIDTALSKHKSSKIEAIHRAFSSGQEPQIMLLRSGLKDDHEAFLVESVAIDLLGMNSLTNQQSGHHAKMTGIRSLDNFLTEFKARPFTLSDLDQIVLAVKINSRWDVEGLANLPTAVRKEALYQATRGYWKLDQNKAGRVRLVFAVAHQIIREVYEVSPGSWRLANAQEIANDPTVAGRLQFDGKPTANSTYMEYIGKSIGHLFSDGAQNPVKYLSPTL